MGVFCSSDLFIEASAADGAKPVREGAGFKFNPSEALSFTRRGLVFLHLMENMQLHWSLILLC